jgi:hypothetical protein
VLTITFDFSDRIIGQVDLFQMFKYKKRGKSLECADLVVEGEYLGDIFKLGEFGKGIIS